MPTVLRIGPCGGVGMSTLHILLGKHLGRVRVRFGAS
jgi:hypothetical protein